MAVTDLATVIDTAHVPDEFVHAPDQPLNTLPGKAVAVNVTDLPDGKSKAQVAPQLIPDGFDVTTPYAEPETVTANP